jgi:hypothetical protein
MVLALKHHYSASYIMQLSTTLTVEARGFFLALGEGDLLGGCLICTCTQ